MSGVLFLLASAVLSGGAGAEVRSACDTRAPLLATLPAETPVSIRASISGDAGTCYKVSAAVEGQVISGWVQASRLSGTDTYRSAIGSAPKITTPTPVAAAPAVTATTASAPTGPAPLIQATQLMKQQQPKAALAVLEKRLQTGGRDYDTLVMAGLAARAADEPKAALGYLQDSQKIHEDSAVARILDEVRREVDGDASAERLYSNRFLLRYEGGALDADTAREMLGVLEEEYARVAAELQCRVDERISTIVQSPEAYRASSDAAEWSGGLFDGTRIRIPLARAGGFTVKVRQAFTHEIVHACLASLGTLPAWLHEGMAQRLSAGPASTAVEQKVRSLLRSGRIPRLVNMNQNWARLSPEHAQNAYAHALVAVDKVFELYAASGIPNLLRYPDRFPQVALAIDAQLVQ
jgi:hypothetical protein